MSRETSSFTSEGQPVVATTPHIEKSAGGDQDEGSSVSERLGDETAQYEMKNTLEESAPSPLASMASQTAPQDQSELTEDADAERSPASDDSTGESASSPHQKRAWRGML